MATGRTVSVTSLPSVASDGSGARRAPDRRVLMLCGVRWSGAGKRRDGCAAGIRIDPSGRMGKRRSRCPLREGNGAALGIRRRSQAGCPKVPRGAFGEAPGTRPVGFVSRGHQAGMAGCVSDPAVPTIDATGHSSADRLRWPVADRFNSSSVATLLSVFGAEFTATGDETPWVDHGTKRAIGHAGADPWATHVRWKGASGTP